MRPIPIVTPNVDVARAAEQYAGVQEVFVPLDLYVCRSCGHLQLVDVINPDVQYNNFRYTTSISLGLPEHFVKFADEVLDAAAAPKGGLVVEIGSNDGTLLRAFKERGMRVLGVDPAQQIAAQATESGVRTLATFFTDRLSQGIRSEHGPADIVVANNTFANIDDLRDFALGVRRLLAPDGVFVFETSYGADVVKKTLIDTVYHEHLSYFMASPLRRYFAANGMDLIDIRHIWTKGGSIRGTAQLAGGKRPSSPTVDAMVREEKRLGFDGLTPYQELKSNVANLQREVKEHVESRKRAGKRLAAYGASVGTVTLIQQFGLGAALEFIADDKPLCEFLEGPDYRIPVFPSSAIYERKPNSIIILAWRYAEPIIAKHQRFISDGGEFIIPLPTVSIRC